MTGISLECLTPIRQAVYELRLQGISEVKFRQGENGILRTVGVGKMGNGTFVQLA